ncbi:MAG TPA: hypothetical protein VGS07_32080 [Thermoanaerobaculia bacterium]|jgi:hypothetical protein|nr:hypothetical protein [Thermoanaerobaculia bacterium]
MSRATFVLVVASLLLSAAGLAPAAQAAVSVTCVGTSTVTFSPGLTLFTGAVAFHLNDNYNCTSSDPTITSGTSVAGRVLPLSCLNLANLFNSTSGDVITWSNGQSSTAQGTFTVTSVGGTMIVVASGTIASGQFTGASVVITWTWPALNPAACLSAPGVTQLTGVTTVQVTSL